MHRPEKKKIFIIGPAFPYRGGPARFNENMCHAFMQKGFYSEIISFTLQYPSLLFPGSSQFENGPTPTWPCPTTRLINTIDPFSWIKTARYINRQKPDVVIFRYWLPFFAPSFGSIARLLHSSIKVIALTDNIIPHEKRWGDEILNRYFISACDGFITMSDKVLNDLNKYTSTPHKIKVYHPLYENYPPLIDKAQARKHLNIKEDEKVLLFFGLIRPYKGLDLLLQALLDERLQNANFKLLIAGEFYENKEHYLHLIKTLERQHKVILKDYFIPDHELNLYFSACDVVVQPYKSSTNSGVSMLSYFYNKPIISTNVGGLAEVIQHERTGWLCEPNPKSIAEAIIRFLQNHHLQDIEQNIQNLKKEFAWEHFVDKVSALIEDIKK